MTKLKPALAALLFSIALPAAAQEGRAIFDFEASGPQGSLAFGEPVTKGLSRGQVHTWTINAQAGAYVEVTGRPLDMDFVMALRYPSGAAIRPINRKPTSDLDGAIHLRWVATESGLWEIDVSGHRYGAFEKGGYELTWTVTREPGAADRLLAKADSLAAQGMDWSATGVPKLQQAIAILEELPGPASSDLGLYRGYLARNYLRGGYYQKADSVAELALSIPGHFPEWLLQARGFVKLHLGKYAAAEALFRRVYAIEEGKTDQPNPVKYQALGYISEALVVQGRLSDAENVLIRAYDMQEKSVIAPNCPCIDWLGRLYRDQKRFDEAEPMFERALAFKEQFFAADSHDYYRVGWAKNNLASVYVGQKRFEAAEPLIQESLAIFESRLKPDHSAVLEALETLGETSAGLGQFDRADSLYSLVLARREGSMEPDNPNIGVSLLRLAWHRMEKADADPSEIEPLLDRAIDIFDATVGFPQARIQAYAARAMLAKSQGDLGRAMDDLEESLLAAEDLRPNVGGGESMRANFFESYVDLYDAMITWQLEAGDVEEAFGYAERGRSRVLLDQLAAGQVDLRSSIPQDIRVPLEAKELGARVRLAELQQRNTQARERADLTGVERETLLSALRDSLQAADADYAAIYGQIKNASPLWRSHVTSGGEPVRLRDVQRKLLEPGDLMLLYEVGKNGSYVFVVGSSGTPEAFPLEVPPAAAAALGVAAGPLTEDVLRKMLGDGDGAAGVIGQLSTRGAKVAGRAGYSAPDRLHALWQTLVPEVLRPMLLETESVVLIPDAMLHMLPFEALVIEPEGQDGLRYWLDIGPAVRYAPSATALEGITQRPSARVVSVSGAPLLLSLSNPVFSQREVQEMVGGAPPSTDVPRLAPENTERGSATLMRLPGTALEASSISRAMVDPLAMETLQGLEATEVNVRAAIEGKRYLHLATHGIVDERRGGLFASLAMTPSVEGEPTLENDGFLQLHEIYDLNLAETELAVLSACETNVGPEVAGEGVFALSRGFLAAGARRVVASQWAVDDASTAELVGSFFAELLGELDPGVVTDYGLALRDAKLAVRNQDQWSDPYYWAPFVLAGEGLINPEPSGTLPSGTDVPAIKTIPVVSHDSFRTRIPTRPRGTTATGFIPER